MSTATEVRTSLRNAELSELVGLLREQQDVRYDVVASADRIYYGGGNLIVAGGASKISDDGVESVNAVLRPTDVFEGGLSQRLNIPRPYLRKMREAAAAYGLTLDEMLALTPDMPVFNKFADLLDHNVNVWLAAEPGRKFLIRGFLGEGDQEGIARAFLSDRHAQYDNLDILMASLNGAKQAGAKLEVVSADLTETKMRVKVACPEIAVLAPELLGNYRNPFADNDQRGGWTLESGRRAAAREGLGYAPGGEPIVFAGFIIGNSETGNGKWSITPQLQVEICRNGLTIKVDAFGKVHMGARLDEGIINWSEETRRKNIELVTAQTTDAVSSFISKEYVQAKVDEIEAAAGVVVSKPTETLERIGKQFGFSQDEQDLILADFISGGQSTTEDGRLVMLGRNSSDLTAIAVAAAMQCPSVTIFSDVEGIFTADPYRFTNTRLIPQLGFRQAKAYSQWGAKVLHSGCIELAELHRVRIQCASLASDGHVHIGTEISEEGCGIQVCLPENVVISRSGSDVPNFIAAYRNRNPDVELVPVDNLPDHFVVRRDDDFRQLSTAGIAIAAEDLAPILSFSMDGNLLAYAVRNTDHLLLAQEVHDRLLIGTSFLESSRQLTKQRGTHSDVYGRFSKDAGV